MYNLDEKIALEGKGISGYFFDQDDNFAGVALYHDDDQKNEHHVPINVERLRVDLVDDHL